MTHWHRSGPDGQGAGWLAVWPVSCTVHTLIPSIRVRSTPATRFHSPARSNFGSFLYLPPLFSSSDPQGIWRWRARLYLRCWQSLHHGLQILVASGHLLLQMIPVLHLPLHDGQLLWPPRAFQALGNVLLAGLDSRIAKLGQPRPVPLPRQDRSQDFHPRHASQVFNHRR